MLTVLDLFSGIGGFSLGLERTGRFKTVGFCEILPFCQNVLKKHWPDVPVFNDIRGLKYDGKVDVIVGGFPCQDISVGGNGGGIEGKRSGLWKEYRRQIEELKPRFAIIENVDKLLSRGLSAILTDLHALGYDAEWHCIPASYVGAPHKRDRVWVIAYRDGIRCYSGGNSRLGGYIQNHIQRNTTPLYAEWPQFKPKPGETYCRSHWEKVIGKFCTDDDGIPEELDEIKAYGNAVVPIIPEIIGYCLEEIYK